MSTDYNDGIVKIIILKGDIMQIAIHFRPFTSFIIVCVFAIILGTQVKAQQPTRQIISISYAADAPSPIEIAAKELAIELGKLFPNDSFHACKDKNWAKNTNQVILLGTRKHWPELSVTIRPSIYERLDGPESYVATEFCIGADSVGVIIGADPAGVVNGVFGMLKKLGAGYYIGFDTPILPAGRPFDFTGWDIADRPLTPTRIVFNWHNFLIGCSTWNLEDWNRWTDQSQKIGYNTIMVHAYGNNPMAGFSFRGRDKPVGYLSSTDLGRSWFVNHVNDVRQMHGGEVFRRPVFGSTAAVDGTDRERTAAAQRLMGDVFKHAQRRGMKVIFSLDVDGPAENPQDLIMMLDPSERFQAGGHWLADPDTSGGYEFYEAQVKALLRAYPQIDTLALWHRTSGTPWMRFAYEEMPVAWQQEFDSFCDEDPSVEKLWHARHIFAMAKVTRAFRKALDRIGRQDVQLAFGSWHYSFMAAGDRFMPADVTLIPLDWMVLVDQSQMRNAESREVIGRAARHRPVLPVVWAHHDDGAYVMRSFRPFDHFQDRLDDASCKPYGFGVIHWMTRPLDLYFESLAAQTWSRSRNEPFEVTCRRAAGHLFGSEYREVMGNYLVRWTDEAPMFARETSDWFVDRPLEEIEPIAKTTAERLEILSSLPVDEMHPEAAERVRYFKGIETFALEVHRLERSFREAYRLLEEGNESEAKKIAAQIVDQPSMVIDRLAKTLSAGSITRGEQGLIVSLNTRWLPHYENLGQRLGIRPIRYNFGTTRHDPIAPRAGKYTFLFDSSQRIWQTLGEKETGATVYTLASDNKFSCPKDSPAAIESVGREAIAISQPVTIPLWPIMHKAYGGKEVRLSPQIAAGRYKLIAWILLPPNCRSALFDFKVTSGNETLIEGSKTLKSGNPDQSCIASFELPIHVPTSSEIRMLISPKGGNVMLSGVQLMPIE